MIEQEELETTGHFVLLRRRQDCRASILATQLFHIDSTGHRGPYKSVLETTIQAMLEKKPRWRVRGCEETQRMVVVDSSPIDSPETRSCEAAALPLAPH